MRLPRFCQLSVPALSLLAVSCSSSDESLKPAAEQWSRLTEGDWSLEPGREDPRWCKKIVLTEDIWVAALRPIHPPGTHHTTVSLVPDDGQSTCSGSSFGPGLIYAAGLGSGELRMPPGVAMKLPAGQALLLGLHIYNPSTAPLAGHSAIEMIRLRPEQVKSEADMLLSGPANLSLPPASRTTVAHSCQVATEQNVFNLFPHMHQLGVHIKTTLTVSGEPLVLHDADYKFEEQYQIPVGPYALRAGDTITTECTYQNDTNQMVKFGESSDTEMCFSILFRYPRGKSPFCAGDTEGGGTGGGGDGGTPIAKRPCAAPGDPGNAVGVGEFCSPAGGQCAGNTGADLCLGDFVKDEEFANFCTMICASDAECGEGAFCGHDSTRICIPSKCLIGGG